MHLQLYPAMLVLRDRPYSQGSVVHVNLLIEYKGLQQCWYRNTDSSMESGVCYLYIAYYMIIEAYTLSTGPILASGRDSMQNQRQHSSTVSKVEVKHSAKESLTRRHNGHTKQ